MNCGIDLHSTKCGGGSTRADACLLKAAPERPVEILVFLAPWQAELAGVVVNRRTTGTGVDGLRRRLRGQSGPHRGDQKI
jgi:hypothetical protein